MLSAALPVAAQDPPAPSDLDTQARAHFQSASAYFETGDYEAAIREFRAAYELSRRPALLFNLYVTYERLGQLDRAVEHLERYLAEFPEAENRAALELRLERLRARAREQAATPAPSGGTDLTVPAIVAFSAAGVGAALFGVFGAAALVEDDSLSAACGAGAGRTCTESQVSGLVAFTVLADVGWVLALAGAATGVVMLLLSSPGEPSDEPSAESSAAVLPWASPEGAGLVLRWRS